MLVQAMLEQSALAHPGRRAVWHNGVWKTYGELNHQANQLAAFLGALGVRPGDRVAILLENSFDFIVAHFGALKANAVEVSLNTKLPADDLKRLLFDCEARVLIAANKFVRQWAAILDDLPALQHVILEQDLQRVAPKNVSKSLHFLTGIYEGTSGAAPTVQRMDLDLASLIYTSGSTGEPKGVMLSHLNLTSNTRSIVEYLGLRPEDRMMVVLPFYYIYGRSLLYGHFLSGGALVIDNGFAFPITVLDRMRDLEATGFAGVPSTFSILLRKTDLKTRQFPALRFVTQAGGGMAPALQQEVVAAFPQAKVFIMYGSTEASPRLTYVEPEMLPKKWGSVGRAIPNVEVVVLDEQGDRVPRGTPGEIAARGPNIMMGYWKSPTATAEALRHGYYHTGDLGYEDADGYIFLTGRRRDIIKVGGNRVSAKEIEDAVLEINGVLETAVIGVPDELLGEAIKAYVVRCQPALTAAMVLDHLGRRLPAYKLPKWVEFCNDLPKTQSGKILKSALQQAAAAGSTNSASSGPPC
ncbi:MAG TPA: class I adenylate-forming enzyme family protein [Verrucomicrobiota bacterium]|nr:class I adenylate-forming enzyme family protein [Verrucomicrobiota bacterium]HNT15553.1 class I adenylate-forming enzyme family protein [Verrucomicrobiota bacterium]